MPDFRALNAPEWFTKNLPPEVEPLWRDPEVLEAERQGVASKALARLPWQAKLLGGILPALPMIPGKAPRGAPAMAQGMRRPRGLGKIPSGSLLGQLDEPGLIRAAQQGDTAAQSEVMRRAQPLVRSIANRFRAEKPGKPRAGQTERAISHEDLVSTANAAIMSAIQRGVSLENLPGYIAVASKYAMTRYVRSKGATISVPEETSAMRGRIETFVNQWQAKHGGKTPSNTLIAVHFGLPKTIQGISRERYVDRLRADIETRPEVPGELFERVVSEPSVSPHRREAMLEAIEKLEGRELEYLQRSLTGETERAIAKSPVSGDPTAKPITHQAVHRVIEKARKKLREFVKPEAPEAPPQSLGAAVGEPTPAEFSRWVDDYARFVMGKAPAPTRDVDPNILRQFGARQRSETPGDYVTATGNMLPEDSLNRAIRVEMLRQGDVPFVAESGEGVPNLILSTGTSGGRYPMLEIRGESYRSPMPSLPPERRPPPLTPEAQGYAGIRPRPIRGGSEAPERFMDPQAHRLLNMLGLVGAQQGGFRSVGPTGRGRLITEREGIIEDMPSFFSRLMSIFGSDTNIPVTYAGTAPSPQAAEHYLNVLNPRLRGDIYRDPQQRSEWELLLRTQLGRRLP